MAETIVVNGLRKTYGDVHAVDGVSLVVPQGEFFGILGPNGAGKTTTLEIIEGLREPDAGTVRLLGEAPWPRRVSLLPRIRVQLRAIQDRGKTIVYTTHYIDEAEILCDRVAIMDRGRILAMDRPATLVRGLDAP